MQQQRNNKQKPTSVNYQYYQSFMNSTNNKKNNKSLISCTKYANKTKKINKHINIACWHSSLSLDFLKNVECVKLRLYDVNLSHLKDLLHLHFLWLYLTGCCILI